MIDPSIEHAILTADCSCFQIKIMSSNCDDSSSSLNHSLCDLEQHAIELARLATTFDKQENWKAASYYYQVKIVFLLVFFSLPHLFFVTHVIRCNWLIEHWHWQECIQVLFWLKEQNSTMKNLTDKIADYLTRAEFVQRKLRELNYHFCLNFVLFYTLIFMMIKCFLTFFFLFKMRIVS